MGTSGMGWEPAQTGSLLTLRRVAQMETRLGALLAGRTCVVYDSDADRSSPAWQGAALRAALQPALGQLLEGRVQPLRHYLHPLRCVLPRLGPVAFLSPGLNGLVGRWVKTAAELVLLRKSAAISAEAMARCIRLTRANVPEAVLAATFGASVLYACKPAVKAGETQVTSRPQVTCQRLRRVRVQGAGCTADGLPAGGRQWRRRMHYPLLAK